jgi:hypothetical protein
LILEVKQHDVRLELRGILRNRKHTMQAARELEQRCLLDQRFQSGAPDRRGSGQQHTYDPASVSLCHRE